MAAISEAGSRYKPQGARDSQQLGRLTRVGGVEGRACALRVGATRSQVWEHIADDDVLQVGMGPRVWVWGLGMGPTVWVWGL